MVPFSGLWVSHSSGEVKWGASPLLAGGVRPAGDTVGFPSLELLGRPALCPHSWVSVCSCCFHLQPGLRGSLGRRMTPAGSLLELGIASRVFMDKLELADGQVAKLAASLVGTTSTGGETLE